MVDVPRKAVFVGLQALVVIEAVIVAYKGVEAFFASSVGFGDAALLFLAGILFLLAASMVYLALGLKTRASTPYYATLVSALFGVLIIAAFGLSSLTSWLAVVLGIAIIVYLVAIRAQFQLRPGEFVKEEKLAPEVRAKVATKIRGVRCRECGDDDVWITSDKLLACRNCGSTDA